MSVINKIFFIGDAKRKVVLINPAFQFKVIGMIVYFFLFIIALFYGANWYFFYQLRQNGIKAGVPESSEYFTFIDNSSRHFNIFFFITALISMVIIYYFGLLLSHRIAGTLYNINKSIDEMIASKKKARISLRKNDFFPEHAEKINELLDKIDEMK